MNIIAMVQARLDSTRLPRKVLESIDGMPVIYHVMRRVMASQVPPMIVCPAKDRDELCEAVKLPLDTWRVFGWDGAEDDVLGRYVAALDVVPERMDGIIRITADCPWLDVETLATVAGFLSTGMPDFVTTNHDGPIIDGYDVEAFTRELLLEADAAIDDPKAVEVDGETWHNHQREHVTPWMRRNAKRPWVVHRLAPNRRWTLDTAEDLEWFRAVAEEINVTPPDHPTYAELLALEQRFPELIRRDE